MREKEKGQFSLRSKQKDLKVFMCLLCKIMIKNFLLTKIEQYKSLLQQYRSCLNFKIFKNHLFVRLYKVTQRTLLKHAVESCIAHS